MYGIDILQYSKSCQITNFCVHYATHDNIPQASTHFPRFSIFADFSQTTFKFPDFSRFSRWIATLFNVRAHSKHIVCASVKQHQKSVHYRLTQSQIIGDPASVKSMHTTERNTLRLSQIYRSIFIFFTVLCV